MMRVFFSKMPFMPITFQIILCCLFCRWDKIMDGRIWVTSRFYDGCALVRRKTVPMVHGANCVGGALAVAISIVQHTSIYELLTWILSLFTHYKGRSRSGSSHTLHFYVSTQKCRQKIWQTCIWKDASYTVGTFARDSWLAVVSYWIKVRVLENTSTCLYGICEMAPRKQGENNQWCKTLYHQKGQMQPWYI